MNSVFIKSSHEIEIMRQGGKILAKILKRLGEMVRPGISDEDLDREAALMIKRAGAKPSFLNYKGYPKSICVSVNDEVVHGLPSKRKFQGGDLVGIDLGILYPPSGRGLHTDAAITVGAGNLDPKSKLLMETAKLALDEAVKLIKPGARLYDISCKISEIAKNAGLSVVKDLCGHGIGENLQEPPSILNFPDKRYDFVLRSGMTICLEPMLNLGGFGIQTKKDGWTVATKDHSRSAHFEHTILVTKTGCEVLTS